MTLDDTEYLTVEAVARRLRVEPLTVWSWVRSGRLPAANLGPAGWRIMRVELERFIIAQRAHGEG
jgi:excisionase family DNA binding protein